MIPNRSMCLLGICSVLIVSLLSNAGGQERKHQHTVKGKFQKPKGWKRLFGVLSHVTPLAVSTHKAAARNEGGGGTGETGTSHEKAGNYRPILDLLTVKTASVSDVAKTNNEGRGNFQGNEVRSQMSMNGSSQPQGGYVVHVSPNTMSYLEFESSTRSEVKVVTQLLSHRYDANIPSDNCIGYFVSVEIRAKKDVNLTALTERVAHAATNGKEGNGGGNPGDGSGTEEEHEQKGGWKAFWNAIVTMLDTSNFCELLPMVMLRVEPEPEPQPYVVLLNAQLGVSGSYYRAGKDCQVKVYITQTPKEKERLMQNVFALGVPLFILLITAPITFMYAHVLKDYLADIDVVLWLVYPAVALRNTLVRFFAYLYQLVQGTRARRQEEQRQRQLEEQHRRIMEQTTFTPTGMDMNDGNNGDVDTNLYPQSQHLGSRSPLEEEGGRGNPSEQEFREASSGTTAVRMEFIPPHAPKGGLRADDVVILEDMVDMDLDDNEDNTRSNLKRPLIASPKKAPKPFGDARDEYAGSTAAAASLSRNAVNNGSNCSNNNNYSIYSETEVEQRNAAPSVPAVSCSEQTKVVGDEEDEGERICRICRDDESEEPVISACECIGSVRWIHASCLDKWRIESTKRNIRNVDRCEICKKPFRVPISRRALVVKNLKGVGSGLLLVLSSVFAFVAVTAGQRVTFGEMTCRAPWHAVSYGTMFEFDGVILTVFLQFMLTMLAAFAFSAVYANFHTDPETLAYLMAFQTLPPFWTRRNTCIIVLIFVGGVLQALALGFLVKLFIYRTSSIVWSWEASPCTGAVLFLGYATFGTSLSTVIHDWLRRRQQRRAEGQALDVEEEMEGSQQQVVVNEMQNREQQQLP
ncbi:hypothetical protein, conserved [Trypanosoma brucei brucei TREU927]|uniref:RING-CH-type domain-containing protein n=1 Tax=Trypanosoma brucei brucei (strain 927/4 GUTat10.1) TaxID=185431 RepID=Q584L7_TRYB2|nr:hypothetical protein, conserved [Trypanosoma brucei brucei TREU927]AAX80534.1 hypothetical protein, conserved [Trypanosoma brucei]AAZ11078.1 hypothetical protein, conserved [Trypanosoma brucei brucei TREU927]